MFFERVACCESISTLMASKRSHARVSSDVGLQARAKCLVANGTSIRLVTFMQTLVMVQVAAIGERLAALVTLEGAPTVMPVQVHHQVASTQKSLFANMTNEWPVFLVHLDVMIVVSNAGKALAACLADEGLFTRVSSLVHIQVAHFKKTLVANVTP
jgi:hypothetical protein